MARLPRFSIVICSYNGGKTLARTLEAVTAQKYGAKLDIIVVDDGSTDDTVAVAESFDNVRVIRNSENKGLAGSRNVGIEAAHGDIVAFTDDDCEPSPTWIKELAAGYTDETIWGVGGTVESADGSTVTLRYLRESKPLAPLEDTLRASSKLWYRFGLYLKGILGLHKYQQRQPLRSVYALVGANMSFRKRALQTVGGFDERFRFGAEEEELCKRLNALKPSCLRYTEKSVMIHHFEPGLSDTLRRSRAYGKGNARMSLKHADVNPIIYPFPLLLALLPLLGFINPWLILTPLLATPLIYSKWLRLAFRRQALEPALYGYIQALQEWCGNLGFIQGYWEYLPVFKGAKARALQQLSRIVIPPLALVAALLSTHAFDLGWTKLPLAIAMLAVPGYLALRALKVRLYPWLHFAFATVMGTGIVMAVGLVCAGLLPRIGIADPLSFWPFTLAFVIALDVLMALAARAPAPLRIYTKPAKHLLSGFFYAGAVALPVLAFAGANLLNAGHSNLTLLVMFSVAAVLLAGVIGKSKHLRPGVLPAVLFSVSLAALWTYSLRSAYVFGWDIQQEFKVFTQTNTTAAWALGAVHTPYDAMLSLTVLPASIARVTGLSGEVVFKVLYPLIFSLLPVMLYYVYRLFVKRWIAFVGAALTIAQFYYMQQFAALARQQIAFLFFALIIYILLTDKLSDTAKRWLAGAGFAGLVVSHYSTTYATIALIGSAWIVTKLILLFHRKHPATDFIQPVVRIRWWMPAALLVGAVIWYGPATHSSGGLKAASDGASVSRVAESVQDSFAPETAADNKAYLPHIGHEYHTGKPFLGFYDDANNRTITETTAPHIAHRPLLYPLSVAVDTLLRSAWWLLAAAGILGFLFAAVIRFDRQKIELGAIGLVALGLFVVMHAIPDVGRFYNVSRMNQQMLIVIAVPAILTLLWVLRRMRSHLQKIVVGTLLVAAFCIASGLANQFAGGNPTANLNNSGSDYHRFYMQHTDIAAAQYLESIHAPGSVIFADRYNTLHFTAATSMQSGFLNDVTPETLAVGAYVYADSTNLQDGVALSQYQGRIVQYKFPYQFITIHKNTLYSNGQAEIYR